MKDIKSMPTILFATPTTFTDYSQELCDFALDTATFTWTTNDALYVGFEKPINSLFCWQTATVTGPRTLTVSLWNPQYSVWEAAGRQIDDTNGLTRSGLISWELNDEPLTDESLVNSIELYWTKFTISSSASVVFRAISGIFSDDNELLKEFPKIMDAQFLLGQTNHLLIHETCRDDIVQFFRKKGMRRVSSDCRWKKFSHWDIMDIDEVKKAATYLALSKIFGNVSNSAKAEDAWTAKASHFKKEYNKAIDLAYMTWDKNSDGAVNEEQTRHPELILTR